MADSVLSTKFIDSPQEEKIIRCVNKWQKPAPSAGTEDLFQSGEKEDFRDLCRLTRHRLSKITGLLVRKKMEKSITGWLYDFIRINIKRGRIFEIGEVLKTGRADCLGYSKLFTLLGRCLGLDTGVAEVVIDNRGRAVPHTIVLVKLAGGKRRFIDFWYGSTDIAHKRLGVRVKHHNTWRIADIDYPDLIKAQDFDYLPDGCVDAITLYIRGNRSLKKGHYQSAVRQYSRSIHLYPQNARTFYNRAIAYENMGDQRRAEEDYARALSDDSSIIRTLAKEPDDMVALIKLDEENIPEKQQQIYLFSKGFITGRPLGPEAIARKMGLSLEEVETVLSSVGNLK